MRQYQVVSPNAEDAVYDIFTTQSELGLNADESRKLDELKIHETLVLPAIPSENVNEVKITRIQDHVMGKVN